MLNYCINYSVDVFLFKKSQFLLIFILIYIGGYQVFFFFITIIIIILFLVAFYTNLHCKQHLVASRRTAASGCLTLVLLFSHDLNDNK